MMGSHNDQKSYCRDPGTVYLHDLTILPDWLVPDQWLRVCLYTGTESEVGFGGGSWTVESPGSFLQRIGEMFEPKEDNGGCHANMIPYDGYCYGTMDYLTESSSLATKGKDQSGRFMTVPSDCEVAPPDSAVVQNVVMMSPFGTTLVVFKDGS